MSRPFLMWRALVVGAAALLSCVPLAGEAHPRGAVALVTEPSPASRGEPFVTADGWTIHVEALVLNASVLGSSVRSDHRSDVATGEMFFRASEPATLTMTGLDAGPALVSVVLVSRVTTGEGVDGRSAAPPVDAKLAARFEAAPDDRDQSEGVSGVDLGPSFVVIARGEKDGVVVKLDVGLQTIFDPEEPFFSEVGAVVRANEVVQARLLVAAEVLFANDRARTTFSFDGYAAADKNKDGVLSVAELRSSGPCASCKDASDGGETMLEALKRRARHIFSAP